MVTCESPSPSETNLKSFFILHKAAAEKSSRRKIELIPSDEVEIEEDYHNDKRLRMEAFDFVWSRIDSTIKDVLRSIDINVFNEIQRWVDESFITIRSWRTPTFAEATRLYPIVTETPFKQLFTGLVFTKNMEFVDDLFTFEEIGLHLKSCGSHVANLSSLDFSPKNGIGGCLRSLLRQFLMVSVDAADISILASWYSEQGNNDNPVVVIIDDMERCCGSVLSDFVLMLSEWAIKIPVILIMGVATTVDAPANILPSNALQHLHPFKFNLGSPSERMDAIVEAVLVRQCSLFSVGYKVAVFLRNYFARQDGTLTSFIRALKIACVEHFSMEPLSYILRDLLIEDGDQGLWSEKLAMLPKLMLKHAFGLQSCGRTEHTAESLAHRLAELKRLGKCWSSVVLCLHEAGKGSNIKLLDVFCEALDPSSYNPSDCDHQPGLGEDIRVSSSGQYPALHTTGFICQAVRKVRDLSETSLPLLLKSWEKHTLDVKEINDKVKELQSLFKYEEKSLKCDLTQISKKNASWRHLAMEKGAKTLNEKSATLLECFVRDYMQPIECIPFHEIVCFKNVGKLQSALMGDPRRRVQVDLLELHKILQCSCCGKSGDMILPSMHDTSIMYTLAQEQGDLINLHDWYQSFKTSVVQTSTKGKHKLKQSPLPKKRKDMDDSQNKSEASIQARFCRAVIELQITGLLRMPSKRRPDYIQRVAFGL